ncbi:MAG: SRPBCC domain-containing protein [bacterium]|nr:SRPBCC domain-containing protein [bacterium]
MAIKEFAAAATINAPAEKIWEILTNGAAYPEWDPYCEKIEGEIAAGETIRAFTKLSPGRAFPVKVAEFEPAARMVWTGGMPLGLFRGERSFTLTPAGKGVNFQLREVFSGPMLFLIGRSLPDMTGPFQEFVAGLKARAEAK